MEVEKMSQRIMIIDAIIENNELLLRTDSDIADLAATGQMLVDSDQISFIYIVEKEDSYQYISIPEKTWDVIREGLLEGLDALLSNKENKLHLIGFREEMDYLVANITGNSNYGEEMVAKVEQVFSTPSIE
jgi:tRNA-dihydrouridine synthase